MSVKNICNFHKYGYCKLQEECKDFHPTEICKNKSCRVSRCKRRHPKQCKYFKSGYCRFKKSCKYAHEEEIKVDDLLEKIIKLEKENMRFRHLNEQQAQAIFLLNERLSIVESKSFLKKYSKYDVEEVKMDEDTSVSDDHSNNLNQEQSIDTTRGLRKQIEFSVEIQTKVKGIKDEISDKSSLEAKEILKNFKDYVNESVKKPDMKITYSGNKEEVFMKLIDKLNIECNKILTHSYKTNIFRTMIDEKLQCFLNELLKIRNLNNKRKNEH